MVEPLVIQRSEHPISRRNIDPDALRVLYRLREANFDAYLVGGSVRDLLLGRRPKDFDIGTSAHPYQVRRLFRNCFVIGRRFRLAHVKFGQKVIEVATFRRQVPVANEPAAPLSPSEGDVSLAPGQPDLLVHHDNTFGTPEEDAFRRDFTINALFYDISTFSIIDYVGGLRDLDARVIRSIGDPDQRFREDPVRMLRAIAFAARLDFSVDPASLDAIGRHRAELARSAPARLLEEFYKILRAGAAEATFRALARIGLLEPASPDLQHGAGEALWVSLAALDRYRRRFETAPPELANAILIGSLLAPLGFMPDPFTRRHDGPRGPSARPWLAPLPVARKDPDRLRHLLLMQRKLRDVPVSSRAAHGLVMRSSFPDALTWLDIHGQAPEVTGEWRSLLETIGPGERSPAPPGSEVAGRRRRRRYRRPPQT